MNACSQTPPERATSLALAGTWQPTSCHDEVTLDYDRRHRRRLRLTTQGGTQILLDFAQALHIREGDALVLETGALVQVRAAFENLFEIQAENPAALVRLAWHLGNRHLAVQFCPSTLRILEDSVIADMVRTLGGTVIKLTAPFDPESGAYAHG